jgi:hypothetical protein
MFPNVSNSKIGEVTAKSRSFALAWPVDVRQAAKGRSGHAKGEREDKEERIRRNLPFAGMAGRCIREASVSNRHLPLTGISTTRTAASE